MTRKIGLLVLDLFERQVNLLCDGSDLHPRVRLNNAVQVLLEKGSVQVLQVGAHDWVIVQHWKGGKIYFNNKIILKQTFRVGLDCSLKLFQRSVLRCLGNVAHGGHVRARVSLCQLAAEDG